MNRRCKVRTPFSVVRWLAAMPLPILSSLCAQIRCQIIATNSLEAYTAPVYMTEEMAANAGVLLDGPPAEIALPHVLAQCDQPTINLLSGNVLMSPGGGTQSDDMRSKRTQNYAKEIELEMQRALRMPSRCA